MLIDKSKIAEAKARLGDDNADIIADILGVEKYDSRNKKGLCPFHDERTPSFVYDPKTYRFHCFGCNKTVDIVDSYMCRGKTFADAASKLFELAGMSVSMGEHKVKTQASYRYPKEEPLNDKQIVIDYWSKRCISKATLDYCDVRQDKNGNTVFNYYDTNDVLTMVKYRPSHKIDKSKKENKAWCQTGADTSPLLFNMNRINATSALALCEGEGDCMSIIESGFTNVVSVPLGAGNFHWIEFNWDWLEQFDSIIICSDNDEAGEKMRKECVYRLGSWRCKVVEIPQYIEKDNRRIKIKDMNEVLYYCGKEKVLELISNAVDNPIPSVTDLSDSEDLDLDKIDGITTGIKEVDKQLMRLFYGTLTILSGSPGAGKTSFLYQIICHAVNEGKGVWLFGRELPLQMTRNWMNYIMAGKRNLTHYTTKEGTDFYKVTPEAKKQIGEYYRGLWHCYNDDCPADLDSLLISAEETVRKYGAKLCVFDNFMTMDMGATADNELTKQTEAINKIIDFARKFNVAAILVAHPRKMPVGTEVGMYDISGTANIANLAHRTLSVARVTAQMKEGIPNRNGKGWQKPPNPYDVTGFVIKDRMLGKMGFQWGMYYDNASRRFYTNANEYGFQYAWDKKQYSEPLQYPKSQQYAEENEVFGE